MRNFSVGFQSIGAVEVLSLVGELDAYTVSELEAAIRTSVSGSTSSGAASPYCITEPLFLFRCPRKPYIMWTCSVYEA